MDYYFEGNKVIFTEEFLTNRGFCCNNGCRHCPYPLLITTMRDLYKEGKITLDDNKSYEWRITKGDVTTSRFLGEYIKYLISERPDFFRVIEDIQEKVANNPE